MNVEHPMSGRLIACSKCNRKILVERGLIGTDHTVALMAACWECLTEDEQNTARARYKIDQD
jgi:hypothetical protein